MMVHFALVQSTSNCLRCKQRRPFFGPTPGRKQTSKVFSGPSKKPGDSDDSEAPRSSSEVKTYTSSEELSGSEVLEARSLTASRVWDTVDDSSLFSNSCSIIVILGDVRKCLLLAKRGLYQDPNLLSPQRKTRELYDRA